MKNKKVPEYRYWGLKPSIEYFKSKRKNISDLYEGEKKIFSKIMFEKCSILDIGCAEGGFIKIIKSFIKNFDYTGVDVNPKMINLAKKKNPKYNFYEKNEFHTKFGNKKFDIVLILGLLHLNKEWKKTLLKDSKYSKRYLIFDLRETSKKSVENIKKSYFRMNFDSKIKKYREIHIPYNILNKKKVESFLDNKLKTFKRKIVIKYKGKPSKNAKTSHKVVTFSNYCFVKK